MKNKYKIFWHQFFKFSLIIKGLDGLLDVVSGFILFFSATNPIAKTVLVLFRRELIKDPQDFIANYFIKSSQAILPATLTFIAWYLLVNGLVKISLGLALFKNNYRIYQITGIAFTIFTGYQIYRFTHTHSLLLLLITLYDLIIIAMLYFEAKNLKISTKG
jgi:uncharacterized membrane protein